VALHPFWINKIPQNKDKIEILLTY